MKFMSTQDHTAQASFSEAVFSGLAPDQGLYVPASFPALSKKLLTNLQQASLPDLSSAIMQPFLAEIPDNELADMLARALNFPIPLTRLEKQLYLLEVFHGPTLAFKDVGARFMAGVLAYYSSGKKSKVTILVATSGDTGSAIAHAFHRAKNVEVFILYPSQKITLLQEMQMTTLGDNIHALEVQGTFDDCQRLVKQALADPELKSGMTLTTCNSINIARLLPQIIYHAWGLAQLKQMGEEKSPDLFVPSGNLGNLTSAVYARQMGFDINMYIAALNNNTVFADYLSTQHFTPRPSVKTFANAMDVGNPSNIERLLDLYHHDARKMQTDIQAISINNPEILTEIRQTYETTGVIIDPHTAVGLAAARRYHDQDRPAIITATAHPAKFPEVIREALHIDIPLPESLQKVMVLKKKALLIAADYKELVTCLTR